MKNKIAIVTPFLSGKGGTETVLKKLLTSRTIIESNDITLIVLGGTNDDKWLEGLTGIKIIIGTNNIFNAALQFAKIIKSNYFSKIIFLSTKQLFMGYVFRMIYRRKYKILSWIHFSIYHEHTVKTKYLKYADEHLAISTGIKQQLIEIGIPNNRIKVIYNPVDRQEKTVLSCVNSEILKIGYIGRITFKGQKNIKELLDSIVLVRNRTLEIHLFGEGEIEQCKRYIKEKHIKHKFVWYGWVNNPWEEINTLDLVVQTSKYEGLPMVLLESISYGVPVIAANCPTGPEDIVTENNGFLYTLGDSTKLAEILITFNKLKFNTATTKNSINKFYKDNYIKTFQMLLESD